MGRSPDCGVILSGDFNQFNEYFLRTHYGYEQLVKAATRNRTILDMVQSIVTRRMGNNERAMFTSALSRTRREYMYTLPTWEEQFNLLQETKDYLLGTRFPYKLCHVIAQINHGSQMASGT